MKNKITTYIVLFTCLCIARISNAQTVEFKVNRLTVIYKSVPKEIVSAKLFVKGGTANYSLEESGIESFAFQLAVTGGTKNRSKLEFSTEVETLGSSIHASTNFDYGQISLRCVNKNWDKSWELFADAIMNPVFEEKHYGLLKTQLIANAKQAESNPDQSLRQLAMANVFEGENYAKRPSGTAESLDALSLEDLKKYYKSIVGKDRSFLVVVGDIDVDDLKKKVRATLAKLPNGTLPPTEDRNMLSEVTNKVVDRDIATNYIVGYMSAPTLNSADGIPMMIAMRILGDRYFVELRTKRSLTYAPMAQYDNGKVTNPFNLIYVSTLDPKQSMEVMVNEISSLKKNGFKEKELLEKKQKLLTQYYMNQETLNSQSQSLGRNEMKGGWEMAESFTEQVNAVTIEDINRVIDKYTDVISWTYLGKEDMVNKEDFLQPGQAPDDVKMNAKEN